MEHLHYQSLLADVLGKKARKIEYLIEERIHVPLHDPRFEHLFLVRQEEEEDERTARDGRGSLGDDGKVVGLLDVHREDAALDVIVERELERGVGVRCALEGAYGDCSEGVRV